MFGIKMKQGKIMTIPYGRQQIDKDDIDAVVAALKSPLITQGPLVTVFENDVAAYCGAKHAVAVNSGTAALHVACLAMGLGAGDLVWTTPITFVASANCARYCGADVDFVDVEPDTGNMSADALEAKLKSACRLPKILIVVHLAGTPADMERIHELASSRGIRIIEDACHALGAKYKASVTGDCSYCDATVFSFHPVKAITTGEGGMVTTNDRELAKRCRLYASHGVTRDPELMERNPDGDWAYDQVDLGFNYRMPDINAALGISQLKKLDGWIAKRNEYAGLYDEALKSLGIGLPRVDEDRLSARHIYVIRVHADSRKKIFDALRRQGIWCNVHYAPVYRQPYYAAMGYAPLDGAEEYYASAITIPLCPSLSHDEIEFVIATLKKEIASGR